MKTLGMTLLMTALFLPTLSQAAENDDKGPPPPPPHERASCAFVDNSCVVTAPDLTFVVSKVNDITPASSNDCKLLPPCSGHRPPPPPPHDKGGDNGPTPPDMMDAPIKP